MQVTNLKLVDIQRFNNPILVYGAGIYASILLTYLRIQGVDQEVRGCIVSKIDDNNRSLSNFPVQGVDEIDDIAEYTIIVAVVPKNSEQVYAKLADRNVSFCHQVTNDCIEDMVNDIETFFLNYPVQENKVFIDCFEGLGYRCNCKYLAQEFRKHGYQIVWNLSDKAVDDIPEGITKVKQYSFEYFQEAYTSKIYITNDGVEPKIHKRKEQKFICSWHGAGPLKKTNIDLCPDDVEMKKYFQDMYKNIDIFLSPSKFNTQVIRRAFYYEGDVLECGSPRMDCLLNKNDFRDKVCEYYKIDPKNKIVLYAPTFRKSSIGDEGSPVISFEKYDIKWEMIRVSLKKRFGGSFVLLYRFHHMLYRFAESRMSYPDAINVTLYSDVQELLGAADILITDYSSIMWDFSLQRKPVFLYQKDLDEYIRDRGFYSDIEEWPYIKARTNEELSEKILGFDNDKYATELNQFLEKYGTFDDGHACKKAVEHIFQTLGRNPKIKEECLSEGST